MSFPNGSSKPSNTATYMGEAPAYQQTSGTEQTGGWAVSNGPFSQEITEGVQAASFVTISSTDPRLKRVGPSQYELTLSLSRDSAGVLIQGGLTDAREHQHCCTDCRIVHLRMHAKTDLFLHGRTDRANCVRRL